MDDVKLHRCNTPPAQFVADDEAIGLELIDGAWTVIATEAAARTDIARPVRAWRWRLSPLDLAAYRRAVAEGALLQAQQRIDGIWCVVARRASTLRIRLILNGH